MLRQVRLDKFPKKVTSFRNEVLNSIVLRQRRPFDHNTAKLIANDTNYKVTYQLYITRKLNKQVCQNIEFIEHVPNLLIMENEPYSLIFEEECQQTLKQYMARKQTQSGLPFLNEIEAKQVLMSIFKSIESFQTHNINYNCLVDHNVVRIHDSWQLSLASILSNSFLLDKNFYDAKRKGKQAVIYAIGSLMFKMLFGFVPFEENTKKPAQFKFTSYIDTLEQETNKRMLKIYTFADRIQLISNKCKQFIEDCLSGRIISFEQCKQHVFFTAPPQSPKKQTQQNREIKMLNYFDKKYHSLIMASIDRRKKYPYEKLHPKMESDTAGFLQLKQAYEKQTLLRFLVFEEVQTESQIKKQEENYNNLKIECKYFEGDFDFQQKERPTMQLIKLIDKDRTKNPDLYEKQDRESKIKLYAFPYAMVFELANVYLQQPLQIKKKIEQLVPYLLEVSSMHWPVDRLVCLHHTKQKHSKFEEIKLKYRELINLIYKHFLTQAMKRYNAKKENLTISEKIRLKEEGLSYYRLCLKLMEVSLIVRKGGKDLDLQRIQTSQRKQIEQDLELILKTYFPNRVEIK